MILEDLVSTEFCGNEEDCTNLTMTKVKTIGMLEIPDLTAESPLTAWNQIGR